MADVINRTTKQFLRSVNEPDFPAVAWIHDPTVGGTAMRDWIGSATRRAPKYVNIVVDVVAEMTDPEKDIVDQAEADAALAAEKAAAKAAYDELVSRDKALALITRDEFEVFATRVNSLLDAIDGASNLATLKAEVALIANLPIRTPSDIKTAFDNKIDSF